MPERAKKRNVIFNWLAKGTRAEPWPSAVESIKSEEFQNLQKIGKQLVQNSKKERKQKTEKT